MSELPRGTVTFLFTDIEGSTRMLKELGGKAYHDLLATHQRLLRTVFAEAGGREIDTQGDSFFVAFHRAQEAVEAAVAGQRALATHPWPGGAHVLVRMGVDTGEPVVGPDRYVGLGVHRTARIMAAGHGGQILVSGTTRDLVEDDLPPDVRLRDLGSRQLKDMDRPVHLFQVVAPGLADSFPPLRTLDEDASPLWRRHRRVFAAAAVVLAGATAAVVFFLMKQSGGSESFVTASPNSVAVIQVDKNRVDQLVPVGDTPTAVEVGAGSVWVLNSNEQTVMEIDPTTRTVARTVGVGPGPTDLAASDAAVWVATASHALTEIDPETGVTLESTTIPQAIENPLANETSSAVAANAIGVWATNTLTAARIDPPPPRAFGVGSVGCCETVALGAGSVWVTGNATLTRLSPRTGRRVANIPLTFSAHSVAVGAGAVWLTDQDSDTVWRVDPQTNRIVRSITVGEHPAGVAVGLGSVWVASADGTVSRIDPSSDRVIATIEVGGTPQGVAAGAGAVWVSVD